VARKNLIRSSLNPYHVYNQTIDRLFYAGRDLPQIWKYCCEALSEETYENSAKIHAFVLMNNHFHLLISTPNENLDVIMRNFQSKLCKMIVQKTLRQQFRFSGPYRWALIRNEYRFANVYKYIYQNPKRASLVIEAEDYFYSTLGIKLGRRSSEIPLSPSELYEGIIPSFRDGFLDWVNTNLSDRELDACRNFWKKKKTPSPLPNFAQEFPHFRKNIQFSFFK